MTHGANPAKTLNDYRHFPERAPLDESLKTAELNDVQTRLLHLAIVI
jgi:hypothetical protein